MMTSWGFLFTNLTVAISYIKKMDPKAIIAPCDEEEKLNKDEEVPSLM